MSARAPCLAALTVAASLGMAPARPRTTRSAASSSTCSAGRRSRSRADAAGRRTPRRSPRPTVAHKKKKTPAARGRVRPADAHRRLDAAADGEQVRLRARRQPRHFRRRRHGRRSPDQAGHRRVDRARDASGLVRDDYFDWTEGRARPVAQGPPKEAAKDAKPGATPEKPTASPTPKEKIDVVVVMLGINDMQAMRDGSDLCRPAHRALEGALCAAHPGHGRAAARRECAGGLGRPAADAHAKSSTRR